MQDFSLQHFAIGKPNIVLRWSRENEYFKVKFLSNNFLNIILVCYYESDGRLILFFVHFSIPGDIPKVIKKWLLQLELYMTYSKIKIESLNSTDAIQTQKNYELNY